MEKNRLTKNDLIRVIVFMVVFAIVIVAFLATCSNSFQKAFNRRDVVGTVTDKDIKRSDREDKYLIYTKDSDGNPQVYEITDSLLAFRFNSSDVYASIEVGKTYRFRVGGKRNTLLSWYPNIYEFEEIEKE